MDAKMLDQQMWSRRWQAHRLEGEKRYSEAAGTQHFSWPQPGRRGGQLLDGGFASPAEGCALLGPGSRDGTPGVGIRPPAGDGEAWPVFRPGTLAVGGALVACAGVNSQLRFAQTRGMGQ